MVNSSFLTMVSGHENEPKYETKATLNVFMALEPDIEHLLTPPPPFCVCVCVCVWEYLYRCCSRASSVERFTLGKLSMKAEYFFTLCSSSFSSIQKNVQSRYVLTQVYIHPTVPPYLCYALLTLFAQFSYKFGYV